MHLWRRAVRVIPGGNGLLSKRPDRYASDIWPTYFSKSKDLGIGQSSWGPFSYIFTESLPSAKEVIKIIDTKFSMYNNLTYEITSASNSGYTIKGI